MKQQTIVEKLNERMTTRETKELVGIRSDSTLRHYRLHHDFPDPIKNTDSPNSKTYYIRSEVMKWRDERQNRKAS